MNTQNATSSQQRCLDKMHVQYLVMINTFEFDHYDCAVMIAGNAISNPGYYATVRADADWLKTLAVEDLANHLFERGDRLDDCQPADDEAAELKSAFEGLASAIGDVEAAKTQTFDELG